MLRKTIVAIMFFCVMLPVTVQADPTIGGFLTEVPDSLLKDISTDSELRERINRSVGGITFSYGGYRDVSNFDGYWNFPQHHTGTTMEMIITPAVKSERVKETVSHLLIDEEQPAAYYRFEKKADGKGRWFWKATSSAKPADNIIPASTVVLFSDPKNIYVNTHEDLLTADNSQMLLPHCSIYVMANEPADLGELESATQLIDATQITAEAPGKAAEGSEAVAVEQTQISGH